jgi:hypothetical protein
MGCRLPVERHLNPVFFTFMVMRSFLPLSGPQRGLAELKQTGNYKRLLCFGRRIAREAKGTGSGVRAIAVQKSKDGAGGALAGTHLGWADGRLRWFSILETTSRLMIAATNLTPPPQSGQVVRSI